MNDTGDEQPDGAPIPRPRREEFDGLKPIRPIAYKKPAAKKPLKEAQRPGQQK